MTIYQINIDDISVQGWSLKAPPYCIYIYFRMPIPHAAKKSDFRK